MEEPKRIIRDTDSDIISLRLHDINCEEFSYDLLANKVKYFKSQYGIPDNAILHLEGNLADMSMMSWILWSLKNEELEIMASPYEYRLGDFQKKYDN